jgi:hypothetical protein
LGAEVSQVTPEALQRLVIIPRVTLIVIIVAFYGSKSHTVFIISIEESQLAYAKASGNPTLESCAPEYSPDLCQETLCYASTLP